MGAFVLNFNVRGDEQIVRGFSRFADDVKDLSEAFREIAKDFREGEQRQFDTEGGYGAGGWAPLSPFAIAKKGHARILVDTGALMRSLVSGGGQNIEIIRPLEMAVGTSIDYARYHQAGTSRMPARPVIALPEDQKTRWHKIIHRYLVKQMKGALP